MQVKTVLVSIGFCVFGLLLAGQESSSGPSRGGWPAQVEQALRRAGENRAELEQALGPACAVSAASQLRQSTQLWQRLVLGALVFVDGLTLVGSAGLIYAVFASAARARRRQFGLLRVVGAVRRQVLALLVTEATLLGLAGSGLGLTVGLLFASVRDAGGAKPVLDEIWVKVALPIEHVHKVIEIVAVLGGNVLRKKLPRDEAALDH